MSENSVINLNLTWPVIMLVHILFSYYNGDWRANVVYFTGYTNLLLGIGLFLVHNVIVKLEKELNSQNNFLQVALLQNLHENA